MGYNSVPDRWEFYSKVGKIIPGSRIVPFKVPLREEICKNLLNKENKFTLHDLINNNNEMKITMIIDLTLTDRFYNPKELLNYDVIYKKMRVIGGGKLPNESDVKVFCQSIKNHLYSNPQSVVGVHCTHGLNRTGYFICRYLIDYLNFTGKKAVDLFETCRGHEFDRINYKDDLMSRNMEKERSPIQGTYSISTTSTNKKISKKRRKRKSQNNFRDEIEISPASSVSTNERISKKSKQHRSRSRPQDQFLETLSVSTIATENKKSKRTRHNRSRSSSQNHKNRKSKRSRSRSQDKSIQIKVSSTNKRKLKGSKRKLNHIK